jgi:hypothetical protein
MNYILIINLIILIMKHKSILIFILLIKILVINFVTFEDTVIYNFKISIGSCYVGIRIFIYN